jgi:hypothetical protein
MPGTVTVACKMPHGIICRLFKMVDAEEPLPGGGTKAVKRAEPTGSTIKLNGYLKPAQGDEPAPPAMPGSYALTHGVDKDLFDEWLKQNQDLDMVKNKLIFAAEKTDYVQHKAKDQNPHFKCGLEPIDRNKLPRGIKSGSAVEAA